MRDQLAAIGGIDPNLDEGEELSFFAGGLGDRARGEPGAAAIVGFGNAIDER